MSPPTRHLVRINRQGKAINPQAIDELLHRDLIEHEPRCKEVVIEIDADGLEKLRGRSEYRVTVLAEDV